jgi:hypothetical protein
MKTEESKKISDIISDKPEKGIPDWLMPILSGLGSMGGSYMLWVKPLLENFKAMAEQIEELKDDIREIKQKQKEVDRNFSGKLEEALKGIKASKRFDTKEEEETEDDEDELILPAKKEKHIRQTKTKKAVTII